MELTRQDGVADKAFAFLLAAMTQNNYVTDASMEAVKYALVYFSKDRQPSDEMKVKLVETAYGVLGEHLTKALADRRFALEAAKIVLMMCGEAKMPNQQSQVAVPQLSVLR